MLRLIGTLNGAVWLGAAMFFSFGIAPGIFSAEMKSIFGDYYTGVIAQTLLPPLFHAALHLRGDRAATPVR
jgi:hypothetical protein